MKTQFGVWDAKEKFWCLFDTLEDAVSTYGCVDVYKFVPQHVGKFKMSAVQIKPTKKKQKKAKA